MTRTAGMSRVCSRPNGVLDGGASPMRFIDSPQLRPNTAYESLASHVVFLLHVSLHIAVEHHPDEQRAIDALQLAEHSSFRDFDLNAEVLLCINAHRLSEAEGRFRCREAVRHHMTIFGVRTSPSWEKPGRHLDHRLL